MPLLLLPKHRRQPETFPRGSVLLEGVVPPRRAAFSSLSTAAAGPVAALYFISSGLPKYAYIGTSAWFFFLVNLFKVPFMLHLQIIDWASIRYSASFMIYAILGALIAPLIIRYINQRVFNFIVWFFVVLGGIRLVVP